jgi:hypothetical protein
MGMAPGSGVIPQLSWVAAVMSASVLYDVNLDICNRMVSPYLIFTKSK